MRNIADHKTAAKHHEEAAKSHHEAIKHHEAGHLDKARESSAEANKHSTLAIEAHKENIKFDATKK